MDRIPIKIDPCPIVEAVVEIRFSTSTVDDAVLGIFSQALKERFSEIEDLPLKQVPNNIIQASPDLILKPRHKLKNPSDQSIFVHVGPKVLSIILSGSYVGWETFSEYVYFTLRKIKETDIISSVKRLGVRYINFFEGDILGNTEIELKLEKKPLASNWTQIIYEVEQDQFSNRINIWNNALKKVPEGEIKGTLIDIDTFSNNIESSFFDNMEDIIEKGHGIEKILFYQLLNEQFVIDNLNPVF